MDNLLEDIGGIGKFQVQMVAALKLGIMPVAWSMMQMSFAGLVPDWWCLPNHGQSNLSCRTKCKVTDEWSPDNSSFKTCTSSNGSRDCGVGDIVFDCCGAVRTVVTEWSLVCDRKHVRPLMTALQMGGVLLGALIGGQASDTVGRRLTVYTSALSHMITSLIAAFSVTWQMFTAMRFLTGVTLGVYLVASFSYPMEFVGPQWRQVVAFIPAWNMGVSLFALMAWLFPDWSHLHMGAAILVVPFLFTWPLVPESIRWLAVKGRLDEAEAVVERVASVNGHTKPSNTRQRLQQVTDEGEKAGRGHHYTYLDVYRGRRMVFTTLILNFIWFSLSFSYYGMSFGVSALSGNVYLNIFIMAFVGIPSNFSTIFLSNRFGRQWTCFGFFMLGSASSFSILLLETFDLQSKKGTIVTGLAMVTKLAVGSAWLVMQTFTSEQYPTVIRSLGYGASNAWSRVGGVLAPVLLDMVSPREVVRGYTVIGSLMALSGCMSLLLHETKGLGLEDVLSSLKVRGNNVEVGMRPMVNVETVLQPPEQEQNIFSTNMDQTAEAEKTSENTTRFLCTHM